MGFFGQGGATDDETGMVSATEDDAKSKISSMQPASVSPAPKMPTSSDVLFLKRLLYLKASIDNEPTLNSMSIPFEQEKVRDNAGAEQLMIDTNAIISGKSSVGSAQNAMLDYASHGSHEMALEPYPQTAQGARPSRSNRLTGGEDEEPLPITDGTEGALDKLGLTKHLDLG